MKSLQWEQLSTPERQQALARPLLDNSELSQPVSQILEQVKTQGDQALYRLTRDIDQCELETLWLDQSALESAWQNLDISLQNAIDEAMQRIRQFHQAGKPENYSSETAQGVVCESRWIPLNPVGLYVPGGTAPLLSTVMMLAIPAATAGCNEIVMCSPPSRKQKSIHPAILAAAWRCGITRVASVGGAQAIAAMAYGTASIPRCKKIFGPGNAWVTEAKQQVAQDDRGAAIDMPAGPSEVMVIADSGADAESVAWDLLSQAEHGPDSQSILITDDSLLAEEVTRLVAQRAADLPRADILSESLKAARTIVVADLKDSVDISNQYAPEHLIINCNNPESLAAGIISAGSVFIGPWAAESLGDYCSGTNHVLPTYGYAHSYSGLSVSSFMRRMTLQTVSDEGLKAIGPCAIRLAEEENLQAHANAVRYRLGAAS